MQNPVGAAVALTGRHITLIAPNGQHDSPIEPVPQPFVGTRRFAYLLMVNPVHGNVARRAETFHC